MKNLSPIITSLAWLILALTGCEKHRDMKQSKNTDAADIDKSLDANRDNLPKPLLSEADIDDPADGYFQAYLLIRESEKTEDQQESIRILKEALGHFKAVESKFPDWKRLMVDARIKQTQQRLDSLSMNDR